jgi:hypothetical protein
MYFVFKHYHIFARENIVYNYYSFNIIIITNKTEEQNKRSSLEWEFFSREDFLVVTK